MMGIKRVLGALLLLVLVFGGTHVLNYPGSVAHFRQATGGQKILDMQPSTSAGETYARLEAMGEGGRELYLRLIVTVDIVFPLAVLLFLVTLARFAAQRMGMMGVARRVLLALPLVYFGLDLLENSAAVAMLARFPERLDWLGAAIGYLTTGKRLFMALAFIVPNVLLLLLPGRAHWQARRIRRAGAAARPRDVPKAAGA
jgi:hypothetical protein